MIDRATLLASVWGPGYSDDHLVDVHVANLRRKLGDNRELAIAPALVCVGMHLVMGHGDAHGEDLLRTAQAAAARRAARPIDGTPAVG